MEPISRISDAPSLISTLHRLPMLVVDETCLTKLLAIFHSAISASIPAELCPSPINVAAFCLHIKGLCQADPILGVNIAWIVAEDDPRNDFWLFNNSQNWLSAEQPEMKAMKKY